MDKVEEKPGEFKPLVDHLKTQKLEDRPRIQQRAMFSCLATRSSTSRPWAPEPAWQPGKVQAAAHKAENRITSVGYVSKQFRESAASGVCKASIPCSLWVREGIEKLDLTADQKARLSKDLAELAKGVDTAHPKFAGAISFSYLTPVAVKAIRTTGWAPT